MPFYLEEIDVVPELIGFKSVLIIPCRFCPAASSALSHNRPYIELFSRALKTGSYEHLINNMQRDLEKQGIKTDVVKSNWLHEFVLCTWTSRKRNKLLERAKQYEALLVLGCEAAVQTIQNVVKSTSCHVIQGMKTVGLMSVKPKFHLPCNISLELDSITPIQKGEESVSIYDEINKSPSSCLSEQKNFLQQQGIT